MEPIRETLETLDERLMEPGVVESIAATMARLRVLIGRRLIGRTAIANVAPGLELSYLDALALIPSRGAAEQETTVGAIARRLRIDPSRASRIVADMVKAGLLLRSVSQADARCTILIRTELGERLHAEIRRLKRELIDDLVSDWPPDEVEAFARMLERFVVGWESRLDALG